MTYLHNVFQYPGSRLVALITVSFDVMFKGGCHNIHLIHTAVCYLLEENSLYINSMIPIKASSCSLYCYDLPALRSPAGSASWIFWSRTHSWYANELNADHEFQEQAHECVRWTIRDAAESETSCHSTHVQFSWFLAQLRFPSWFSCQGLWAAGWKKTIIIIDVIMFRLCPFFSRTSIRYQQCHSLAPWGVQVPHIGSVSIKKISLSQHSFDLRPVELDIYIHHTASICFHFNTCWSFVPAGRPTSSPNNNTTTQKGSCLNVSVCFHQT